MIDNLQALTADQQTEARFFEKFFDSDEWKATETELKQQLELEKERCILATSWEDNRIATGRLLAYSSVLNWPSTKQAYFEMQAMEKTQAAKEFEVDVALDFE